MLDSLRKVILATGAVALASLGIAACGGGTDSGSGGGGQEGGEMNITLTSFPDYLDPQLSYTLEGWEALWVTYTPLLTYKHEEGDAGNEVIPGLAEDLPTVSDDGKTWSLKLRDGMKYSDGSPIKASDFKFSVERLFDVQSGGESFYTKIVGAEDYSAGKADHISGIQTNDQTGEITIQLTAPSGTFLNELGLMFVAPIPSDTPNADDPAGLTNNPPPSSGPFMITSVDAPRSFVMERNPQFKTIVDAGAPVPEAGVDKITVTENKNQSAQVTGVEQNDIDFMVDPPPADRLPEVESQYSDRFQFEDSINTYYFWMNNAEPPFNDVRVRQAVNYALDPEAVNRIEGGRFHTTQQILPPGMPGYEEYTLYPGPDLDKAKQLMAEANPSDKDITVWTDDEPDRIRLGQYYEDVLKSLGFNTDLKVIAGAVYFTVIGNQKTPNLDTGFTDWFQDYPHPNDFFQPLLAGESILPTNNQNNSLTDIPELNKEMADLAEQPLADVEDQYAELDKQYMEQAVWAPYGNERFTTFVSDRVDFDALVWSIVFAQDFSSFQITD